MGRIINGANGGFSGKAGSIIGSSWKSINYIKGLYKKRTKPATQAQLEQQAKFSLLMKFLVPINPFLKIGFAHKKSNKAIPTNVAFQTNLATAVTGVYPDYTLDYAQIRLADGSLYGAGNVTATYESGEMILTWDTGVNELLGVNADDPLYVVAYHSGREEFITAPSQPTRADGTLSFAVPVHLQEDVLHVWYFMSDRNQSKVSKSVYLGEITVA